MVRSRAGATPTSGRFEAAARRTRSTTPLTTPLTTPPYYNHRVCGERRTLALAPELETRGAWYLSEMMKAITYLCTCAYK